MKEDFGENKNMFWVRACNGGGDVCEEVRASNGGGDGKGFEWSIAEDERKVDVVFWTSAQCGRWKGSEHKCSCQ